MTSDGGQADVRDDDGAAVGAPPLATLAAGAPSCRVVHLLEEWHRWSRAQALRLVEDPRVR